MRPILFDCNCAIGPAVMPEAFPNGLAVLPETDPAHWTAKTLIAEMDYFGISAALVYHKQAEIQDPRLGNTRLMEEIGQFRGRLHPCWVVLPHHTGETPAPDELLKQMDAADVRAVRIYPWAHNFSLAEWSCGPLFRALEGRGTLVFVDHTFGSTPREWAGELLDVCQRYPRLRVVLSGRPHWQLRTVYQLAEVLPDLLLDIGWLGSVPSGIADAVRRFGAKRVLFGTRFLPMSPGSNLAALAYADISAQDRRHIAGENLAHLLGLPVPNPMPLGAAGAISASVDTGESLCGHRVVDAHVHVGPLGAYVYRPVSSSEDILRSMDQIGIDQSCINSMWALTGDMREGNNEIAGIANTHPERFVAFAVINPRAEGAADEVERCVTGLGMRGIKLHPRLHITPLSDISYEPVLETAERLGVPVESHSTRTDPFTSAAQFKAVAQRHSLLKLIMCHGGNDGPGVLEGIQLAKRYPNITIDTTGVGYWHAGFIERAVKELGADRVLFGSDLTLFDQACQIGPLGYARLSDEDKAQIMGDTIRRLLS